MDISCSHSDTQMYMPSGLTHTHTFPLSESSTEPYTPPEWYMHALHSQGPLSLSLCLTDGPPHPPAPALLPRSPWPHSEATQPGSDSETWHFLSLPASPTHTVSPFLTPPSSNMPAQVPKQPSGWGGMAPQRGHRGTVPCSLESDVSHKPAPCRLPLSPLSGGRHTDRQTDPGHTHCHTHTHAPTAAPQRGLFLIMGQCACLLTQLEMVRE